MIPILQKCFSSKPLIFNNLPPYFKPRTVIRAAYATHTELTLSSITGKKTLLL